MTASIIWTMFPPINDCTLPAGTPIPSPDVKWQPITFSISSDTPLEAINEQLTTLTAAGYTLYDPLALHQFQMNAARANREIDKELFAEADLYMVHTNKDGRTAIWLYSSKPHLKYRAGVVYEERINLLPFIPDYEHAKIHKAKQSLERDDAVGEGWTLKCPARFEFEKEARAKEPDEGQEQDKKDDKTVKPFLRVLAVYDQDGLPIPWTTGAEQIKQAKAKQEAKAKAETEARARQAATEPTTPPPPTATAPAGADVNFHDNPPGEDHDEYSGPLDEDWETADPPAQAAPPPQAPPPPPAQELTPYAALVKMINETFGVSAAEGTEYLVAAGNTKFKTRHTKLAQFPPGQLTLMLNAFTDPDDLRNRYIKWSMAVEEEKKLKQAA